LACDSTSENQLGYGTEITSLFDHDHTNPKR